MTTYLARLGELTLKHSNIKSFEKRLVSNLREMLYGIDKYITLRAGRLYVECADADCQRVEGALCHLVGIAGWARTKVCDKTIEAITAAVRDEALEAREKGAKTFKLEAMRQDKSFPLNSYRIVCEAASSTVDEGILCVDVHHPDVKINIEVRAKVYVYRDSMPGETSHKGTRGLPVGSSGHGLLLLSGGLDSPVAGYRMVCRGMTISAAYFHAYPYTSDEAREKVEKLASILRLYALEVKLFVVPFTAVQMRIKEKAPQEWTGMMLRVCMIKAANEIAQQDKARCIITGESLGQVASQTMDNLIATEHFAALPIFRPLIGMNKEEIVSEAKAIGTYDTSILPYQDCCVLFAPRHPILKASISEAERIYQLLDCDELIKEAVCSTQQPSL